MRASTEASGRGDTGSLLGGLEFCVLRVAVVELRRVVAVVVLAAEITLLRPLALEKHVSPARSARAPQDPAHGRSGCPREAQPAGRGGPHALRPAPASRENVPIFAQSDLLRTVSLSARTTPNHRVVTPSHKPVQCRRCDKAWGDRLKRLLESGLVSMFNFTRSSHVHAICA
jgi:hypothetical protein